MPTYDDAFVSALVDAMAMPPGFALSVTPQRKHKYRNLWNITLLRNGERVWGRASYTLPAVVVQAGAVAWAMSREAA